MYKPYCMAFWDFLLKKNKPVPSVPVQTFSNSELEAWKKPVPGPGGFDLPAYLLPHWDKIAATALPSIHIEAVESDDLALEDSKFGHYPYLPALSYFPKDGDGNHLNLLAQINCNELPPLEGFPNEGYLQFYIAFADDVYGLDFNDAQRQNKFRVLYFREEDYQQGYHSDFSAQENMPVPENVYPPFENTRRLCFRSGTDYMGLNDFRGDPHTLLLDSIQEQYPEPLADKLAYHVPVEFSCGGHKMGGYAHFCQDDPRGSEEKWEDYILLLQIDSDDHINWGDAGVANFFIHKDDLAKRDFSKVLYNWDCY